MKVLVTGSDGYIGTLLMAHLTERGHRATGLDAGYYHDGELFPALHGTRTSVRKDIRDISTEDLTGFDAVVHLAELSNDPLGQLNPKITFQINHLGSLRLARLCKRVGISRFVYTSSCSVYGAGGSGYRTEASRVCPQTAYAECKVLVERDVSALADDDFSPSFLRNATAYGPSPRMRFDLVLNNLSGLAWTTKRIALTSDGTPWRPLVHVRDICQAIVCTLEAPRGVVHNQVFNVGRTLENYRVREIASIVAETFPGCELTVGNSDGDKRSYRVSFDKISEHLPGFSCRYDVGTGAKQLLEVFTQVGLTRELFQRPSFTRVNRLRQLLAGRQRPHHSSDFSRPSLSRPRHEPLDHHDYRRAGHR